MSCDAMKRILIITLLLLLYPLAISASDDDMRVDVYTTQDGLSHRIIFEITQADDGYIYLATWNGLCRFDAHRFETFNQLNDTTLVGRLHSVRATTEGRLACLGDNDSIYLFDRENLRFTLDTTSVEQLPRHSQPYTLRAEYNRLVIDCAEWKAPRYLTIEENKFLERTLLCSYTDRQGNLWVAFNDALYKITFTPDIFTYHRREANDKNAAFYNDEIRAFKLLQSGERWIATKNGRICIYDSDDQLMGYLAPNGTVSSRSVNFASKTYTIDQDSDGTLWISTKSDGLFSATPLHNGNYRISVYNVANGALPSDLVYDVYRDANNRLWVATFGGGVNILSWRGDLLSRQTLLEGTKVRYITSLDENIAVTTTQGLYIFDLAGQLIQRVSTYDVSYILSTPTGTYVATMAAGLFRLVGQEGSYDLQHIALGDAACDVILALATDVHHRLWVICDNCLVRYDADGDVQQFDQSYFHSNMTFSEAHPCIVDSVLRIGCSEGWLSVDERQSDSYLPFLGWKSLQVGDRYISPCDTVINVTAGEEIIIDPVAIDFRYPTAIRYAYRIDTDTLWQLVPPERYIYLQDLSQGKHTIEVRSTDSYGIWAENNRSLTIHVHYGTPYKVGAAIFLLLVFAIAFGSWWYRRKKRHRKVIVFDDVMPSSPEVISEKEQFLNKAVACVEEHIADVDFTVDTLADTLRLGRTILYKQMKDYLDMTPATFIRDLRIKRAMQLLRLHRYTVAEVAYMTGFSDAKYFGKVFKKEVGMSPVEYSEGNVEK